VPQNMDFCQLYKHRLVTFLSPDFTKIGTKSRMNVLLDSIEVQFYFFPLRGRFSEKDSKNE